MSGLFFDGNLRVIYEVPEGSSYTVDGSGYRIYDQGTGGDVEIISNQFLWSEYVDWIKVDEWAFKAFSRSGGAFRSVDSSGNDFYAPTDIRLINGYQLVPANYPHQWLIEGNVFDELDLESSFDTSRITVNGVSPRISFVGSGSTTIIESSGGSVVADCEPSLNYPELISVIDGDSIHSIVDDEWYRGLFSQEGELATIDDAIVSTVDNNDTVVSRAC